MRARSASVAGDSPPQAQGAGAASRRREAKLPRTPLALGLLVASLAAIPQPAPAPGAPARVPSCLLVTLDTTRADRLGCYGSAAGITPALDAFARRAALFEACEAAVPQTVPSHVTLFSGWDPSRHGVRKNLETQLPRDLPLLAEEFKASGRATAAFVSSFVLLPQFGLGRGFDTYDAAFYSRSRPEGVERRAAETLKAALPWLLKREGPWFCWVHLFDPHAPYDPPEPYASKYRDRPYDGEVASMDAALGEFLGTLDQAGRLKDALVILCADHGEGLGDHGEPGHGIFLYEATTHVPLLMRVPGQTAARRVSREVGLVDVAATVRALAGLPARPGDGTSLAPLLEGRPVERPPVYMESLDPLYDFGWAPLYALRSGPRKFILAPRKELYRLDLDPGETQNRILQEADTARRLRETLASRLAADRPAEAPKVKLDAEELRSLQSLGYVAGTPGTSGGTSSYRDPKDAVGILRDITEGTRLFNLKRYDEAAPVLEEALKQDPRNATVAMLLGQCYEAKEPAKALVYYKRAIQSRPAYPQPYLRAISLLNDSGRAGEAYALGRVALRETEDYSGMLQTLLAWSAHLSGRPDAEVLGYLEGAARSAPPRPLAFKLKALLAVRAGDKERALKELERMAADAPPFLLRELGEDPAFAPLREDPRFWKIVLKASQQAGESP